MRLPPQDTSPGRGKRITAAWVLGALLLSASAALNHFAWKEQTSAVDQALFLRYVDRLEEAHHVLTTHPEAPRWWVWILGYRDPGEILEERELAYRGAGAAGFLPLEAGPTPGDRATLAPGHREHPHFFRALLAGGINALVLALSLPFAVFAWRSLTSGTGPAPAPPRTRHWKSGAVLATVFWSLLAAQLLAGLVSALTAGLPVVAGTGAAWIDSLSYLILQGLPVLWCAMAWLPGKRHFVRAFGLGFARLRQPATLALGFGLFGIDSLANIGLYEVEKASGGIDTRDFLPATLIDAGFPGLLAELFSSAVVAPVGEEILFRGFLFTGLRGRLGTWGAALFSSLIFGSLHPYSWFGVGAITLFGLFACWIFVRTGSLWPGILLHALSNFSVTLFCWYVYSDSPLFP